MDFSLDSSSELAPALVYHLQKLDDKALANALLNKHFYELRTLSGYRYVNSWGQERSFILFGELAGADAGTEIQPHGDFDCEQQHGRCITDDVKIRDRYALRVPKGAPPLLQHLARMQIATLNEVRMAGLKDEEYDVRNIEVQEWLSTDGTPTDKAHHDGPDDIIIVHTRAKFCHPRNVYYGYNTGRITFGNLESECKTNLDPYETWVGRPYDAHMFPGYDSEKFALDNAKLIQQDIRNAKNELIPAWQTQYELRPGCLLIMEVHLGCEVTGTIDSVRKVYRIIADRVRVLTDIPVSAIRKPEKREETDLMLVKGA